MSYVFMKLLESAPERYDAGINILTLGRLRRLKQDIIDEFIGRGDRVLDLGCGTGSLAILCAAKGAEVTGVDLSPKMLAIARRKINKTGLAKNIKLLRVSAMDMDTAFADNSFDVIASTLVFSELSREEISFVLKQCHRVLKANGILLIADEIMPQSLLAKFLLFLFRLPFTIIAYIFTQTTTRAVASLDENLRQAKFSIIKVKSYLLGTIRLFQARKVVT
ncbi:MAG: corrinoid protein-associated methyltransferase CpaM [Dehalococcoidales bacterium]